LPFSPGECCGYLDESSLLAMGLSANQRIPVAVSMIDAHAGVLGLLATKQARAKGEPENQVSIQITRFNGNSYIKKARPYHT